MAATAWLAAAGAELEPTTRRPVSQSELATRRLSGGGNAGSWRRRGPRCGRPRRLLCSLCRECRPALFKASMKSRSWPWARSVGGRRHQAAGVGRWLRTWRRFGSGSLFVLGLKSARAQALQRADEAHAGLAFGLRRQQRAAPFGDRLRPLADLELERLVDRRQESLDGRS